MHIFSYILSGTIITQLTFLLLLCMSVGSWYIIILKVMSLRSTQQRVRDDLKAFQEARDMAQAMHMISREGPSPVYRIAQAAVRELKRIEGTKLDNATKARLAKENLQRALDQGTGAEMSQLASNMAFLGSCANASPYIGLFGTVWGVMVAFQAIGDQKSASLATVAPGMSEALISTALGLAVAIPASISFNILNGLSGSIEGELASFGGIFLNRIHREMPWIAGQGE